MKAGGWRWYVFGAQAVIAYGVPRLTNDVDITAEVADDSRSTFVEAMVEAGFELRATSEGFVERTRVLPFFHTRSGVFLDVVLAGPGLEPLFLDRTNAVDHRGSDRSI